jgi:hypothetical protein
MLPQTHYYHQRFIQGYSKVAWPLHDLTRDVPFMWRKAQEDSLESLKAALVVTPILGRFHLETDTSDVATGAVLSQEQDDRTF